MVIYGTWEDEFNYIADDFPVQFKIQIFFCGYLRRVFRWPFDYRGFIIDDIDVKMNDSILRDTAKLPWMNFSDSAKNA